MSKYFIGKVLKKESRKLNVTVLLFFALFGAIIASVVITLHNYIDTDEKIEEKITNVSKHEPSGIYFDSFRPNVFHTYYYFDNFCNLISEKYFR